jgi:hypothetical protein
MQIALEFMSLLIVGWVASTEVGSWWGVQPVVERLPYEQQVAMEQGMLRTFGRIMPILMPLSAILAIALVVVSGGDGSVAFWLRVITANCIAVAIVTTVAVNVPLNSRTAKWQLSADPTERERSRQQWHFFQGMRAGLFMAAFIMLALAASMA